MRRAIYEDDVIKLLDKGWKLGVYPVASNIHALPSAKPEQRWISVSERFPEEGEEVLVYLFDGRSPYLAWIQDGLWCTEDFVVDADYEPVAWMPLPEPYQAERREE